MRFTFQLLCNLSSFFLPSNAHETAVQVKAKYKTPLWHHFLLSKMRKLSKIHSCLSLIFRTSKTF